MRISVALLVVFVALSFGADKRGTVAPLNTFGRGSSAVSRSVQDKLNEHPSVKDYGAKCDGSTDDTAAFQAALAANAGGEVFVPSAKDGVCVVSGTLAPAAGTRIYGAGATQSATAYGSGIEFPNTTEPLFDVQTDGVKIHDIYLLQTGSGQTSANIAIKTTGGTGKAHSFDLYNLDIAGFYSCVDISNAGGSANLENVHCHNQVSDGVVGRSAQGWWRSVTVEAAYGDGFSLKWNGSSGLSPWIIGAQTYANGGCGIRSEVGFEGLLSFFFNNDSGEAEICGTYAGTTVGDGGTIGPGWIQYAGYNPWSGAINVTGATNANPIVISFGSAHGRESGDTVDCAFVGGNTAANGTFTVTKIDDTSYSIGVAGTADYTSGGKCALNTRASDGFVNPYRLNPTAKGISIDASYAASVQITGINMMGTNGGGIYSANVNTKILDSTILGAGASQVAGGRYGLESSGAGSMIDNVYSNTEGVVSGDDSKVQHSFFAGYDTTPALSVTSGERVRIDGNTLYHTAGKDGLNIASGVTYIFGANNVIGTETNAGTESWYSKMLGGGAWVTLATTQTITGTKTFQKSLDEQIAKFWMVKNDGGSQNAVTIQDDRGYAGDNTGAALGVSSWSNSPHAAGTLFFLQTLDGNYNPFRLLIDNATGGGFVGADWTWNNNTKIMWKDASAKSIPGLWLDTSEDFHVGPQAAPTTGNGALSLYARGQKLLTLMAPPATGRNTFYPLVSGQTQLGAATGCGVSETDPCHWGPTYIGPLRIYTDTPADPAFIDLYAGTYGENKAVRMYGPATFGAGTGYSIYWPAAAPATGSVLGSSSGGTLAWLPNGGLPTVDTTAIVKGSVDATKQVRLEADGLTTGTTRVLTVPDSDITLMSIDTTQTITGSKLFNAYLTMENAKGIYLRDSGGTAHLFAHMDAGNDVHVGMQDITDLPSGNGALSLYARGNVFLKALAPVSGYWSLAPLDANTNRIELGSATGYFGPAYVGRTRIATNGPTTAYLAMQSGDGNDWVTQYGPATMSSGAGYNLYWPSAQATAAGQTLINDGSGVLSWGSSALPAGTANYTLRYDGGTSAWVASGALTNDGSTISINAGSSTKKVLSWLDTTSSETWALSHTTHANGNNLILEYFNGSSWTTPASFMSDGNVVIGTTDNDGTPATGRLVAQGSTSNGSTNIFVGRDSGAANVWTLDTDGNTLAAAGAYYGWSGRSRVYSSADGYITLTNAAGTDFNGLRFGGSTSYEPMWKNDADGYGSPRLTARLADDSDYAQLDTGDLYVAGTKRIHTTGRFDVVSVYQSGTARIDSVGQGNFAAIYSGGSLIANNSGQLTSSNGYTGTITVRKGDDSGSCTISVSAGIVTATTCS